MTRFGTLPQVASFAALGAALGFAHLVVLRRNIALYLSRSGPAGAIGLHLLRIVLLVAALVVIARAGATALLSASAGLLVGWPLLVARERRRP